MSPLGPGLYGLAVEDKLALSIWEDWLGIPLEIEGVRDVHEEEFETLTSLGQVGSEPPPEWYGRNMVAPEWYRPDTMYETAMNGGLDLIVDPYDDPRVAMIDAVDRALKALAPREREAVELWKGFRSEAEGPVSLGRVAEIMDTRVADVKRLVASAIGKLGSALAAVNEAA